MGAMRAREDLVRVFKYQGSVLFPGCAPGDTVVWEDVTFTVTPQGHLEGEAPDGDPTATALDEVGVVTTQEE